MITLAVTLDKVKNYFHEETILKPAERMQQTLLRKAGAYTRAAQRNSFKRAMPDTRRSLPGKPPLRHIADPDIKRTVFFFVDTKAKEMVCGMVLLRNKSSGRPPMPGTLENSGDTTINTRKGPVRIHVEARPSAVPAFEKMQKKLLPELIRGGIMREV